MAFISLPVQMSTRVGCVSPIHVEADTLEVALDSAIVSFPTLQNKIYAKPGEVNRFIRVFVDGKQAIGSFSLIPLRQDSEVRIMIAMAGG